MQCISECSRTSESLTFPWHIVFINLRSVLRGLQLHPTTRMPGILDCWKVIFCVFTDPWLIAKLEYVRNSAELKMDSHLDTHKGMPPLDVIVVGWMGRLDGQQLRINWSTCGVHKYFCGILSVVVAFQEKSERKLNPSTKSQYWYFASLVAKIFTYPKTTVLSIDRRYAIQLNSSRQFGGHCYRRFVRHVHVSATLIHNDT